MINLYAASALLFVLSVVALNLSEIYTISRWAKRMASTNGYNIVKDIWESLKLDKGSCFFILGLLFFTSFISLIASILLPQFRINSQYIFLAGTALVLIGLVIRRWSVHALGTLFTHILSIRKGHVVVSTGPYKYLRHPAYSGSIIAFLGVGIGIGNWISVAFCIIIPFISCTVRIIVEEKMLTEHLGKEYKQYISRVRYRLIPGVW